MTTESQFHQGIQILGTVIKRVVISVLQKFLWPGKEPGNLS